MQAHRNSSSCGYSGVRALASPDGISSSFTPGGKARTKNGGRCFPFQSGGQLIPLCILSIRIHADGLWEEEEGWSEKEVQEVKLIQSWRQTGTDRRQPENQLFPSPSYTLGGNAFLSWNSHHGRQNGGFSEN